MFHQRRTVAEAAGRSRRARRWVVGIVAGVAALMAGGRSVFSLSGPWAGQAQVVQAATTSGTWGTAPWSIDAGNVLHIGAGTGVDTGRTSPWQAQSKDITAISIDGPLVLPADCSFLFGTESYPGQYEGDWQKLAQVTGLAQVETSHVTTMLAMFQCDAALTQIDGLADWNVSSVTSLSAMFASTPKLASIGSLAKWNVENVTNLNHLFESSGVTDVGDLGQWQTGRVTDMSYMFNRTAALQNIGDISGWDTSNVTDMHYMFANTALSRFGTVADWNVAKVTTIVSMFMNDANIQALDFTGWQTGAVTADGFESVFFDEDDPQATGLQQVTFGPHFTITPALPNATARLNWRAVGTGTTEKPQGLINLTTVSGAAVTSRYTGADPDTYVLFDPGRATATVTLVDDDSGGAVVGTPFLVSGDVGATASYSATLPTNFALAAGQSLTGSTVLTQDATDNVTIRLVHLFSAPTMITALPDGVTFPSGMQPSTIFRDLKRTIHVTDLAGTNATIAQTVTYFRYVTYDLVTLQIVSGSATAWHLATGIDAAGNLIDGGVSGDGQNEGVWPAYTPPSIVGHAVRGSDGSTSAPKQIVDAATGQNMTLDYWYVAAVATATVTYRDQDGTGIASVTLSGSIGETLTYSPQAPVGYDLVGAATPLTITITADDLDNITIKVVRWRSQFPATGSAMGLVAPGVLLLLLFAGAGGLMGVWHRRKQ